MSVPGPSFQQLKDSMRSAWMAGDFGVIARTISSGAEDFIRRLSIPPGAKILDVACGTGNLAIPLARSGAIVTGVDIAPNLLVQARDRAATEALNITFDEGDAEALPYPAGAFDVVVTMFGAMFAPRPNVVAAELGRVLRPGGLLAMANWTPEGFSGQMFQVNGRHVPPHPGLPPPVLWGSAATVRQRLEPCFTAIATEIIPLDFNLPMSPSETVAFFRQYFGPTQVAFNRLDEAGQSRLSADLEQLWSHANTASDPHTKTRIHNEYLEVTATRR